MANHYDIVAQITSGLLPEGERALRLQEFSKGLGWRPSDRLDIPGLEEIASAHLLVEHGLEHSAVLTFLRPHHEFVDLDSERRQQLLSVSYNNLVDWHVAIEPSAVSFIYVRANHSQAILERRRITRESYDDLRSEIFEQIAGRRPQPNFPALDDALIQTISFWKRALAAELGGASNTDLSRLFNALLFARALEDQRRREQPNGSRALLDEFATNTTTGRSIREVIGRTLTRFVDAVPTFLFEERTLGIFDELDQDTVRTLLIQFYDNKFAPYPYDFAVISKHALSRIYEHYVSLLRRDESSQLGLLPQMPSEYADRSKAAVYTPQFIARFFARYLRAHTTPFQFKRLRVIDPACGSGIFLRTLLEFQCDPTADGFNVESVQRAFQNARGIDLDANAIAATQLSLSLLHLVLTNQLPTSLPLAVGNYLSPELTLAPGDVAIVNPPFVPTGMQDPALRQQLADVMGVHGKGRRDLYLGFLKRSIDVLEPGGFGFFVLPQSFLVGNNASGMRQYLSEHCWVRCLADLSAIRVFGDTNVYVILLVFQRKDMALGAPAATVIKCQDLVGHALQDAVDGKRVEQRYYSIYDAEQKVFESSTWFILPPSEAAVRDRLESLPRLRDVLDVKQGMITGADDVFILDSSMVPADKEGLFIPLLADREMKAYGVPRRTGRRVFFPFWKGEKINEQTLRKEFPTTWRYLCIHKKQLEGRSSLARYGKEWWEPMWPREPGTIQRPKIVTPHLVITPRFGLDVRGRFAVSHSPFLIARAEGQETDILKLMLAILSSRACYWYIQRHSHRYSHGYAKLENKTLQDTPVPDVTQVSSTVSQALLKLVDKRIKATSAEDIGRHDAAIEDVVSDLYGLTAHERRTLGLDI